MKVRIWVERMVGVPFGNGQPNVLIKHFPPRAHEFQDVTDTPFPAVGTKPVELVIERAADGEESDQA